MVAFDLNTAALKIADNANKPLEELSLRQNFVLFKVTSCLYYMFNESLIEDTKYDNLCRALLDDYDPDIVHVDTASLKAGTGYTLWYGTATYNISQTLIKLGVV